MATQEQPKQLNEQTLPVFDPFDIVINSATEGVSLLDVGKTLSSNDAFILDDVQDIGIYAEKYKDKYPLDFIQDVHAGAKNFKTFYDDNYSQLRNEVIKENALAKLPVNRQGMEVFGIKTPSAGKHYSLVTDPLPENLRPFFSEDQLASMNDFWVNKYDQRIDGQPTMAQRMENGLLLEYDMNTGDPYWRERKDGEYHYGKAVASAWGDPKKYGYNIMRNAIGAFITGLGPMTAQGFGTMLKGGKDIDDNDPESGDAFDIWMADYIMQMESMKYKPSEEIQKAGFKTFAGASYNVALGVGMIVPQILVGRGAGLLGAGKTGAALAFAAIGGTQGYNDVYSTFRENGVSPESSAMAAMIAFPAIMATEYVVSGKYFTRGFTKETSDLLKASFSGSIKAAEKGGLDTAKEKTIGIIVKNALSSFYRTSGKLITKAGDIPIVSYGMGALREGMQESMEESVYILEQMYWNSQYGYDKDIGFGRFDVSPEANRQRLWDSFIGGALIGGFAEGIHAALTPKGYKKRFDQDPYAQVYVEQGYEKGKAMLDSQGYKFWKDGTFGRHNVYPDGTPIGDNPDPNRIEQDKQGLKGLENGLVSEADYNYSFYSQHHRTRAAELQAAGLFDPRFEKMYNKELFPENPLNEAAGIITSIADLKGQVSELEATIKMQSESATPDASMIQNATTKIEELNKAIVGQEALLPKYLNVDANGFSERSKEIVRTQALKYAGVNGEIDIKNPLAAQEWWKLGLGQIAQDQVKYQEIYAARETAISDFEKNLLGFDETVLDQIQSNKDLLRLTTSNDPKVMAMHSLLGQLNEIIGENNEYNANTITNQPGIAKLQKIRDKLEALSVETLDGDITRKNIDDTPDDAYETIIDFYNQNIRGEMGDFAPDEAAFNKAMTEESHVVSRFMNPNSKFNKSASGVGRMAPISKSTNDDIKRYFLIGTDVAEADGMRKPIKRYIRDVFDMDGIKKRVEEKLKGNPNLDINEEIREEMRRAIRFFADKQMLDRIKGFSTKIDFNEEFLKLYDVLNTVDNKLLKDRSSTISGIKEDATNDQGDFIPGSVIDEPIRRQSAEQLKESRNGWNEDMVINGNPYEVTIPGIEGILNGLGAAAETRMSDDAVRSKASMRSKAIFLRNMLEPYVGSVDGTNDAITVDKYVTDSKTIITKLTSLLDRSKDVRPDSIRPFEIELLSIMGELHRSITNQEKFIETVYAKLRAEVKALKDKYKIALAASNSLLNVYGMPYDSFGYIHEKHQFTEYYSLESFLDKDLASFTKVKEERVYTAEDLLVASAKTAYYIQNISNLAVIVSTIDPNDVVDLIDKNAADIHEWKRINSQQLDHIIFNVAYSIYDKVAPFNRAPIFHTKETKIVPFTNKGFIIQGMGGSGKSSMVPRATFKVLDEMNIKRGVKDQTVTIAGVYPENLDALKAIFEDLKTIKIARGYNTHNEFLTDLDKVKSDWILIDEVSRLLPEEVLKISSTIKDNANLVFVLDPNQSFNRTTSTEAERETGHAGQFILPRTNPLVEDFRAFNKDVVNVIRASNAAVAPTAVSHNTDEYDFRPSPETTYNKERTFGVQYAQTSDEVYKTWLNDSANRNDYAKRKLIVQTVDDAVAMQKKAIEDLKSLGKTKEDATAIAKNIRFIAASEKRTTDEYGQGTIQGQPVEMNYVAFPFRKDYFSSLDFNTSTTRTEGFLMVIYPGGVSKAQTDVSTGDAFSGIDDPALVRLQHMEAKYYGTKINELATKANKTGTTFQQPIQPKPPVTEPNDPDEVWEPVGEDLITKRTKIQRGMYTTEDGSVLEVTGMRNYKSSKSGKVRKEVEFTWGSDIESSLPYDDFKKLNVVPVSIPTDDTIDDMPQGSPDEQVEASDRVLSYLSSARTFSKDQENGFGNFFVSLALSQSSLSVNNPAEYSTHVQRLSELVTKRKTYNLVYYPEIILNDVKTGKTQPNYNVLIMEDLDGNRIGVLNQPMWNDTDTGYKSLDKNTDYVNGVPDWSDSHVNDYTAKLASLYVAGQQEYAKQMAKANVKLDGVPIGRINVSKMRGGSLKINYYENFAQPFKDFFNQIKTRGGKFMSLTGQLTDRFEEIRITQEVSEGIVGLFAEVTYLNDPDTIVRVEVKNIRFTDRSRSAAAAKIADSIRDKMNRELKALDDVIAKHTKRTRRNIFDFMSKYNETDVHGFFMQNRSIIGRMINETKPDSIWNQVFFVKDGKVTERNVKEGNYPQWLNGIKDAHDILLANNAFVPIKKQAKKNEEVVYIPANDLFMTEAKDMYMPSALGRVSGLTKVQQQDNTISDFSDMLPTEGVRYEPATMEEERDILEYYFGANFINNRLAFKFNPKVNGQNVYGYVDELRMVLGYDQFMGVLRGVGRHEAVHYALRHFVDPDSYIRILEATKKQIAFQEETKRDISDKEAAEFLAEVNRGVKTLKEQKGITGLLKSVIDWFAGLFNRSIYGTQAIRFLMALNRGDFKNATEVYRNYDDVDTMAMDDEGTIMEEILHPHETGSIDQLEVEKIFGNRDAMFRAQGHVIRNAFNLSPYNKDLLQDNPEKWLMSFEQALDKLYMHQGEKLLPQKSKVFSDKDLIQAYAHIKYASELPVIPALNKNDQEMQRLQKIMVQEWMGTRVFTDKKLYNSLVQNAYSNYKPTEEEQAYIQNTFWENREQRDAFTSMSSVLKMYLSTISYNQYNLVGEEVRKVTTTESDSRYLKPRDMDNILKKIAVHAIESETDVETTTGILLNSLTTYAKQQLIDNPEGTTETNYIYSLLDTLAFVGYDGTISENDSALEPIVNDKGINHYDLAYKTPQLLKHYGGILGIDSANPESMMNFLDTDRGKYIHQVARSSHNLITALTVHYASLRSPDQSVTEMYYFQDGAINKEVYRSTKPNDLKANQYKSNITSSAYLSEQIRLQFLYDLNVKLDDKDMEKVTKGRRRFRISKNGNIEYQVGQSFNTMLHLENGQYRFATFMQDGFDANNNPEYRIDKDVQEAVYDALRLFGLQETNTGAMLKAIFQQGAKRNVNANVAAERDNLADMLGTLFMIGRTYAYDSTGKELKTVIDTFINKYKSQNLPEKSLAEHWENKFNVDIDLEDESRSVYSILRIPNPIEKWANFANKFHPSNAQNMTWTADRKKQYRYRPGNMFEDSFFPMAPGKPGSFTLGERILRQLMNLSEEDRAKSRLVKELRSDGSPVYYEPLLKQTMLINSITQSTGIQRATARKGKPIGDMKERDLINATIYGAFMETAMNASKVQELSIPVIRFSDSSKVYNAKTVFKLTPEALMGETNLLIVNQSPGAGVSSMRFNEAIANEMFNDDMDGYFASFMYSLNKFIDTPFGISSMDVKSFMDMMSFDSDNLTKYTAYQKLLDTLRNNIGTISNITSTDPIEREQLLKATLQGFASYGLVKDVDFSMTEKDGTIIFGLGRAVNNTQSYGSNHDVFNLQNYFTWKHVYDRLKTGEVNEKGLVTIRHKIFQKRFTVNFEKHLKYAGKLNQSVAPGVLTKSNDFNNGWIVDNTIQLQRPVRDEKGHRTFLDIDGAKFHDYEWHPYYEAFYMAYFFLNNSITNTFSHWSQFPSGIMQNVRGKQLSTPGILPVFERGNRTQLFGLPPTINAAIMSDALDKSKALEWMVGMEKIAKITDGSRRMSRTAWKLMTDNYGGVMGEVRPNDKTVKTANAGFNPGTGLGSFDKAAIFIYNRDTATRIGDTAYDALISYMLSAKRDPNNPDLGQLYMSYRKTMDSDQAQDEVARYIERYRMAYGIDLAKDMLHIFDNESTHKLPDTPINAYTIRDTIEKIVTGTADDIILSEYSIEGERVILNVNKEPVYGETILDPSQIKNIIGVGEQNAKRIETINEADFELGTAKIAELFDPIRYKNKNFSDLLKEYLTKVSKSRTDAHYMLEKAGNSKISGRLPGMFGMGFQSYVNDFNKAFKPSMVGASLVQAPEDGPAMIDVTIDGVTVSYVEQDFARIGIEVPIAEKRMMYHYRFLDAEGNDIENAITPEETNEILSIKAQNKKLKVQIEKLGVEYNKETDEVKRKLIERDLYPLVETLDKGLLAFESIRQQHFARVATIIPGETSMPFIIGDLFKVNKNYEPTLNEMLSLFVGDKMFNVRALVKENAQGKYYTDRRAGLVALQEFITKNFDQINKQRTFAIDPNRSSFVAENARALYDYYEALLETLDVYVNRIPATIWSSGEPLEVVYFSHSDKHAIVNSAKKMLLDDSDFDIDKLNVYYKSVKWDEDGFNALSRENMDNELRLNNTKFNAIYGAYLDTRNLSFISQDITIEKMKEYAPKKPFGFYDDFPTAVRAFLGSQEGKNLVARFANAIHVFSTLNHTVLKDKYNEQGNFRLAPGFQITADGNKMTKTFVNVYGRVLDVIENTLKTLPKSHPENVQQGLGNLAQGSLDNAKHFVQTFLNINEASSNMVIAMAMSDLSADEIFTTLKRTSVYKAIHAVQSSLNLDSKTKLMHEYLHETIESVTQAMSAEGLDSSFARMITVLNENLKTYKDKQTNNLDEIDELEQALEKAKLNDEGDHIVDYDDDGKERTVEEILEQGDEEALDRAKRKLDFLVTNTEKKLRVFATLEGRNKYNETKLNILNKKLNALRDLEMYDQKGQVIFDLMTFFGLNQGVDVDPYVLLSSEKRMKDLTYTDRLRDIHSRKSEELTAEQKEERLKIQGRNLPGFGDNQPSNKFYGKTQKDVTNYMESVLKSVKEKLGAIAYDTEYATSPDKLSIQKALQSGKIAFEVWGDGQSGFAEAGAKAASNVGWTSRQFMTQQRSYVDITGKRISDFASAFNQGDVESQRLSSQRFDDFERVSIEDAPENTYHSGLDKIMNPDEGADVVMSFEDVPSDKQLNAIRKSGNRKAINMITTSMLEPSDADKVADAIVGRIVFRLGRKEFTGEQQTTFKVGIVGNTMDKLIRKDYDEFTRWFEREKKVRAYLPDYRSIIQAIPNVNGHVKFFDRLLNDDFGGLRANMPEFSPQFEGIINKWLDGQKLNWFTNEAQYIALVEKFHGWIMYESIKKGFFSPAELNSNDQESRIGFVNGELMVNLQTPSTQNNSVIGRMNMTDYSHMLYFTEELPEFIIEQTKEIENYFLSNLIVDNGVLTLREQFNITNDAAEKANLKESLNQLTRSDKTEERSISQLIQLYVAIKSGFKYGRLTLHDLMPDSFFENESRHFDKIDAAFRKMEGKELDEFQDLFLENAVAMDNRLASFVNKDQFDAEIYPKYVTSIEHIFSEESDMYDRTYKMGRDVIYKLDDTAEGTGMDKYDFLFYVGARKIAVFPMDMNLAVRQEVIRPTDLIDKRKIITGEKSILMRFPKGHGYKNTDPKNLRTYVKVQGVDGIYKLSSFANSVSLQKVNIDEITKDESNVNVSRKKTYYSRNIGFMPRVSHMAYQTLFKRMQGDIPGVEIVTVDNETTTHGDNKGYFENGKVYFNVDRVTADTFVHEVSHPIILLLKNSPKDIHRSLYNVLRNEAISELNSGSVLSRKLKTAYAEKSYEDMVDEMIATKLGFQSVEKVLLLDARITQENARGIVAWAKRKMRQVIDAVKDFMGITRSERESSLLNINALSVLQDDVFNEYTTYGNIASAIVDDILNNNLDLVFGNMFSTDPDANKVSLLNVISELSADSKPIESLDDYMSAFLTPGNSASIKQTQEKARIGRIYSLIINSNDNAFEVQDKIWDMRKYMGTQTQKEDIVAVIRTQIIPEIDKYKDDMRDAIRKWVSPTEGNMSLEGTALRKYFPKGKVKSRFDYEDMVEVMTHVGISHKEPILGAFFLDNINDYKGIYPELANIDMKGFNAEDTLVIVHAKRPGPNGNTYDISLLSYNVSPLLYDDLSSNTRSKLITKFHLKDKEARGLGITLDATMVNVKRIEMMLQFMGMVDKVSPGTIQLRGMTIIDANRKVESLQKQFIYGVNFHETLGNIRALAEIDTWMEQQPEFLRRIYESDVLMNDELFQPDYLEMLINQWKKKSEKSGPYFKFLAAEATKYHEHLISDKEFVEMLRNHQQRMKYYKKSLNLHKNRIKDLEYKVVSQMIVSLTKQIKKKNDNAATWLNLELGTAYSYNNELVMNYKRTQIRAFHQIGGLFDQFTDEYNKHLVEYMNRIMPAGQRWTEGVIRDMSYKLFDRILMREKLPDGTEFRSMRVHWDDRDPRTMEALRTRKITREDLDFGKYIAEKSEKFIKDLIRQHLAKKSTYYTDLYDDNTARLNVDALNKKTEDIYTQSWQKGMLPVVNGSVMDLLTRWTVGSFVNGMGKFITQTGADAIYEDIANMHNVDIDKESVNSHFISQILGNGDPEYGSHASRLSMLGLSINTAGEYYMENAKSNEMISNDISQIMRYLAMDSISKPIMENDVLPMAIDMKILANIQMMDGVKGAANILKFIDYDIKKNVFGLRERAWTTPGNEKLDDTVNNLVRLYLRATTFSGVALSIPVAITSLTNNVVESILEGIANHVGNPYDMFNFIEWGKAALEFIAHPVKVEAVARKYQVVESSRYEKLNNQKYYPDKNSMFDGNFMHAGNRLTDIMTRKVAMVAQMIHDGTWEAHDKDGNYDVYKDKRFYPNGSLSTDRIKQETLKWLTEDLAEDPRYAEQKDKPLAAYSADEETKLQMISDLFVIGVYNREMSPVGDNKLWYNVIFQFKKYMNAKVETRLRKKSDLTFGAKRTITINDFHEVIRSWTPLEMEGTWRTFGSFVPGITYIMEGLQLIDKAKTLKDWTRMTPMERHNMARFGLDMSVVFLTYLVFSGLRNVGGEKKDDETEEQFRERKKQEQLHAKKYARIYRALENGLLSIITTAPDQLLALLTEPASIGQLKRMIDTIMGIDPIQNITYMVPGGGTIRMANDWIANSSDAEYNFASGY